MASLLIVLGLGLLGWQLYEGARELIAERGPLPFLLLGGAIVILLRMLGLGTVLLTAGVAHAFAFMLRSRPDTPTPTYDIDIREYETGERIRARATGFLTPGISAGDEVSLQGRWQRGVFFVWGGTNERLGAKIRIEGPGAGSWGQFAMIVIIYGLLAWLALGPEG